MCVNGDLRLLCARFRCFLFRIFTYRLQKFARFLSCLAVPRHFDKMVRRKIRISVSDINMKLKMKKR